MQSRSNCDRPTSRDTHRALNQSRVVLGPDHRGGCYLIGLHASDRTILDGIAWQQNTDFAELVRRAGADRALCLAVKFDLDCLADVLALAKRSRTWRALIESLLISIEFCVDIISPSSLRRQRIAWQTPPPLIAA